MLENAQRIEICDDCLLLLANGPCEGCTTCVFSDKPSEEDCQTVRARMAELWATHEITLGHLHDECDDCDDPETGGEPWFSMADCEGCGSALGGNRQYATVWPQEV